MLLPTILFITLASIYLLLRRKYNYWKRRNVKYLTPTLILGNYGEYFLQKKSYGDVVENLCRMLPAEPYIGAYFGTQPVLIIQDPDVIKTIIARDFYYFNSRELMDYIHCEHMNCNLFFSFGENWKVLRQNMTPLFSPARMKNMFYLIEKCAHTFESMLDDQMQRSKVVESRTLMARYSIEIIGSCVFGIDMNTLTEDPEKNAFLKIGEVIFENSIIRAAAINARSAWPSIFYGLGLRAFPKELSEFFHRLLLRVFEARNNKPSTRNDFIDLLLSFKEKSCISAENFSQIDSNEKIILKVDDELLSAQCIVFFAAGYETSSAAMSFTLYELAKHEEIQSRAMQDVDEYLRRHDNKIDYECINELPYLEACVNEAMRIYPALGVLFREVVEDYTLSSGLRLEKGLMIHLPVQHLHHNPDYFPEPEKFRPERFIDEKSKIRQYTYMPFGEGPRMCIGMRFSRMETMSGLITVLKKYRVMLADDMPRRLELEPRSIVTQAKGGVRLKLVPREHWEQRQYNKRTD